MNTGQYWIKKLGLNPHPEGGYFKRTYCSEIKFLGDSNKKAISSGIYYLLNGDDISQFHRIKSDELWFFHTGSKINIHIINSNGEHEIKKLGLENELQIIIGANTWFAAELEDKSSFGLVSCMVSPEFKFEDFEIAKRSELTNLFPRQKRIIELFTVK